MKATETQREKELIRKLTWAYNQDIPTIPIQAHHDQTWYTTDDWKVPAPDSPSMSMHPVRWLPRLGKLDAKLK